MDRRYYRLVGLAVVLGVGIGLFATAFRLTWNAGLRLVWGTLEARYWRIVVSTAAGLLIGGIIHLSFYPGTLSTVVGQFHRDGRVPPDDALPVVPTNLVGLVAGQSAGPEGMMSVVGGGAGTALSERVGAGDGTRKLLTLAGMGAGFGTILGAPIGGALLWLELPHERGLEYYEALVPTFAASFAGYLTMTSLGGLSLFPTWNAQALFPLRPAFLAIAVGVGALAVPFAYVYTELFRLVGRVVERSGVRPIVQTTAAGLGIGLLGYALPLSYFYGGKHINAVLAQSLPLWLLAATLAATMLAAALTINGKWQGGLIIPHMFMGAVVGRMVAVVVPGVAPAAAMLAGMAAFNAAVTGTPLSSALIAIALTNGAGVVPVFLASFVAHLGSPVVRFLDAAAPRSEGPAFYAEE